jgi:predicted nucleotidyltransferase component of viral defense system
VRRELVTSEYDDVRPFVVTVLAPEHLMAEKIRAMLVRGKPRDLYDIWLLLEQGFPLDDALIERKLALYGLSWDRDALVVSLDQVRTDWERDLRHLLPQYVPFEFASEAVAAQLA